MLDVSRWVFIEDEGLYVGWCLVDSLLFERMRNVFLVFRMVVSREVWLYILVEDYVMLELCFYLEWMFIMCESVDKFVKWFGGDCVRDIREKFEVGDFIVVVEGLFEYYDGLYDKYFMSKCKDCCVVWVVNVNVVNVNVNDDVCLV